MRYKYRLTILEGKVACAAGITLNQNPYQGDKAKAWAQGWKIEFNLQ